MLSVVYLAKTVLTTLMRPGPGPCNANLVKSGLWHDTKPISCSCFSFVVGLLTHIVSYTSGWSTYSPLCFLFKIIVCAIYIKLSRNNTMGSNWITWSAAHHLKCLQAFNQKKNNHQQKAWDRLSVGKRAHWNQMLQESSWHGDLKCQHFGDDT